MTFSSRFIGVGFLFWCSPPVNPLMTGDAERHQITLVMCAALRNRSDVMHKRCENISPPFFALLAERMPCRMTITNPAPRAAIPLVLIVPTREMVIVSLHNFFVRLAVAAFSICKIRTARHAAGTFRLSRHCTSPSKKPSRRIASPRRLIPYPILAEYIISLSPL